MNIHDEARKKNIGKDSRDNNARYYSHQELLSWNPQVPYEREESKIIKHDELPSTYHEYIRMLDIQQITYESDDPYSLWFKPYDADKGRYGLNAMYKEAGSRSLYTEDHIKEWCRCRDSVLHFAKYVVIQNIDFGNIRIPLRWYQHDLLKMFEDNKRCILMLSRQTSKSTLAAIFIAHFVIFNTKPAGIVANTGDTSAEILDRCKTVLECLPDWLQPTVKSVKSNAVIFEHGAKVSSHSGSPDSVRGRSFSLLFCDEMAFWSDPTAAWRAISATVSSGRASRIIIASTPNGLNHFHSLFTDAVDGKNDYAPYIGRWDIVPDRMYDSNGNYDAGESWKESQISEIGRVSFEQEHLVSFLNSLKSLIAGEVLNAMATYTPDDDQTYKRNRYDIKMFCPPKEDHVYTIAIDPSEGCGLDSTAITVMDHSVEPKQVVLTIDSPLLYPHETAAIVSEIGVAYNEAGVVVETNIEAGVQIIQILRNKFEYQHIFKTKRLGADLDGIKMTKRNKGYACDLLKASIEESGLIVSDEMIIQQLMRFCVTKDNKGYAATDGHDDLVMSLILHHLVDEEFIESLSHRYELPSMIYYQPNGLDHQEQDYGCYNSYGYDYKDNINNGISRLEYNEFIGY